MVYVIGGGSVVELFCRTSERWRGGLMPDLIRRLPRRRHPRLVRDLRFKHFLAFGVGSACPFRYLVWIVVQGFSAGSPSSPYFFY